MSNDVEYLDVRDIKQEREWEWSSRKDCKNSTNQPNKEKKQQETNRNNYSCYDDYGTASVSLDRDGLYDAII